MSDTRVPAKVRVATCEADPDRGWVIGWVHVEGVDSGWGQGFGGIALSPPAAADFIASVCALFGVTALTECAGRNCFVLRSWPSWGSDIEGIEVDGRRFTLTDFRRKHWPDVAADPLARRRESILNSINYAGRDVQRYVAELGRVEDGYIDWSTPTGSADR
jgi:hypothetical protein